MENYTLSYYSFAIAVDTNMMMATLKLRVVNLSSLHYPSNNPKLMVKATATATNPTLALNYWYTFILSVSNSLQESLLLLQ